MLRFGIGQLLPIFQQSLLVIGTESCLQCMVQPILGDGFLPACPVAAQVRSSTGGLAFLVDLYVAVRRSDDAYQFSLGPHLLTLHAGSQRYVLGCQGGLLLVRSLSSCVLAY